MTKEIPFEIIHEGIIESTIPLSNEMIDKGKKENFLLNCDEQTHGRGSGNRKWASQRGNALTTLNIRENYMPKDTLKLTPFLIAISVVENINKIAKEKFGIKWPNDILCVEKYKIGGILVDKYKDFYQLSFGINLSQCPDSSQIRKGGRTACKLGNHCDNIPNPLEFSILLCKDICKRLQTYNCKQIIEEWKKFAIYDVKITKRDDESGKLYKPLDIDLDGKLKVIGDDGKEEVIDPQFPFVNKI
jgi:biotin-[acetyl-CoA-carboxylase] ligase BirA-like protein